MVAYDCEHRRPVGAWVRVALGATLIGVLGTPGSAGAHPWRFRVSWGAAAASAEDLVEVQVLGRRAEVVRSVCGRRAPASVRIGAELVGVAGVQVALLHREGGALVARQPAGETAAVVATSTAYRKWLCHVLGDARRLETALGRAVRALADAGTATARWELARLLGDVPRWDRRLSTGQIAAVTTLLSRAPLQPLEMVAWLRALTAAGPAQGTARILAALPVELRQGILANWRRRWGAQVVTGWCREAAHGACPEERLTAAKE